VIDREQGGEEALKEIDLGLISLLRAADLG
jgi:hypothetical protein